MGVKIFTKVDKWTRKEKKTLKKTFLKNLKTFLKKASLKTISAKCLVKHTQHKEHKGGRVLSYLSYFHIWFIKYVKCNLNSVNLLSSVHFFDLIFRLCFKIYWCKVQSIWSYFRKILDFNLDITFIIIANVNVSIRCLWILTS